MKNYITCFVICCILMLIFIGGLVSGMNMIFSKAKITNLEETENKIIITYEICGSNIDCVYNK